MYEIVTRDAGGAQCLAMPIDYEGAKPVSSTAQVKGWIAGYRKGIEQPQPVRDAVAADARLLLPFATQERATTVLDLLWAYHAADDAVKAGRQAVVAAEFSKYLGPLWNDVIRRDARNCAYRIAAMNVVPDAFLRDYAAAVATLGEFESLLTLKIDSLREPQLLEKIMLHAALRAAFDKLKNIDRVFAARICLLHQTRPLTESRAFAADVNAFLMGEPGPVLLFAQCLRHNFPGDDETDAVALVRSYDAQAKLLTAAVKGRLEAMDAVAAALLMHAETRHRHCEALHATYLALAAGRDLGSVGADAAAVAEEIAAVQAAIDAQMLAELQRWAAAPPRAQRLVATRERLQRKARESPRSGRGRSGRSPTATVAPSANEDSSPVHAWSVARLVEWIDGPPSGIKTAIDRGAVAARHAASLAGTVGKAPAKPSKAPPSKPPETKSQDAPLDLAAAEKNVDLVLQSGLCECARFLLADAREMRQRSDALGMTAEVKRLDEIQTRLQHILDARPVDEVHAAQCFNEAEEITRAVRRAANKAEAGEKFRHAFPRAVFAALKNEPLWFDKRHGGSIEPCDFRREYWGWVSAEFHGRCLATDRVQRVHTKGVASMRLREGEALAFYVTGSSLSGHAFDITVHLWRRREASVAAPADESGFMNEAHWYDTRIPYCVLHVGERR